MIRGFALESRIGDVASFLKGASCNEQHSLRRVKIEAFIVDLNDDQLLAIISRAKAFGVVNQGFTDRFAVRRNLRLAAGPGIELQFLIADPQVGDVIKGTGGLRKVRWAAGGKGKRGGVRVIYYVVDEAGQVRLLLIYKKGIQDDLTAAQRKQLKAIKDGWA